MELEGLLRIDIILLHSFQFKDGAEGCHNDCFILIFLKSICKRYKTHNNKSRIKSLILEFLISLFTRTNLQHVESILAARVCVMV